MTTSGWSKSKYRDDWLLLCAVGAMARMAVMIE